jgi:putative ABC transport system ATP-binding protein
MGLKLIQDAAYDMGKTIIIVTHNVQIAEMANSVIHMKDGKIFEIKYNDNPKSAEEIIW